MKWKNLLPLLTFGCILIFGGCFAYYRFHHGNINGVGAILLGIAFPLFGAISLFDGRLLPRLGVFVKAMMLLITWGLLTHNDLIKGNTGNILGRSALKCGVVKSALRLAKSFIQQQGIHQRNPQ